MELQYNNQLLAILIPMYNEEKIAAECIDKVVSVVKILPVKAKLIVINDGSQDNTFQILQKKQKEYKKYVHIITHPTNKGYGAALQTGTQFVIKHAYSWILHMDSDLTNDPRYILKFVQFMSSSSDCIKASRYIAGGKVIGVSLYRRVISMVGNTFASWIFHVGIKDCTNGFRMVRVSILTNIEFHENNFSIILEEMYWLKKRKARFVEFPYILTARQHSSSHFLYKPKIFYDYFKYAIKSFFIPIF